jgi:hypothetical protein
MYYHRLISLALLFLMVLVNIVLAETGSGSFVNIRFGKDISINWPKDWENRDGRTNKLINTATESTLSLAGVDVNWHENRILINSSYSSNSGKRLASLRLSSRPDKSLSQKEMKELLSASKEELKELFSAMAQETKKMMMSIEGIKSFTTVESRIVKSKHIICFYSEAEVALSDSTRESYQSITYICPTGANSIKLFASINKSVDAVFRPITRAVWESLQVK